MTSSNSLRQDASLLKGLRLLICRPGPQGQQLADYLNAFGAECRLLPTLEICPLPLTGTLKQKILDVDLYDMVIVVSAHAADAIGSGIDQYWPQLPIKQRWFAIGKKTATHLSHWDIHALTSDAGIDSEALLEHPELQEIEGKRILIARGKGGREHLFEALKEKGALPEYADFYERKQPAYNNNDLSNLLDEFNPAVVIALSQETIANLLAYTRQIHSTEQFIKHTALLVPGQRVASFAIEQGFGQILMPTNLELEQILDKLRKYWQNT